MIDQKKRITLAALSMSFATFLSRISGYVKDMVLAGFFGAGLVADTFFVAFRIPNLLRELFAEGSISSAFIPVLSEYRTKYGDDEARKIVRMVFTLILMIVGGITIIGIIASPLIVTVIAPGFISNPEKFNLTVTLTRIMFPFLLFISLSSLLMGALNVKRVFFIPSFAPVMLNLSVIFSVLIMGSLFRIPIMAVAAGVTLGGLAQILIQLPSFLKNNYDLRISYSLRHEALKKIIILIIPATMGMAVSQINIFVSTIIASFLKEGSITYLYYSMRLIQFPVGIFGVAMGMAVLPMFSEHASRNDFSSLKEDFSFSLKLLLFITIPSMFGLIVLRHEIVEVLFERGRFAHHDTIQTAYALLFYSLGIWSIVGVRIITATFYAIQNTITPVKVAGTGMLINIVFSIILMRFLEHGGLALANSIASWSNFFILYYLLRKKLGRLDTKKLFNTISKIFLASLLMSFLVKYLYTILTSGITSLTLKFLVLLLSVASGVIIYITIMNIMKSEELQLLKELLRKRRRQ